MQSTCTLAGGQRTRTTQPPVPDAAPVGEEEAEVAPAPAGADSEPAQDSSTGEDSAEDDSSSLSESGNSCSSSTSSSSVDDPPRRKKKKRHYHKTNTANDKRGRSSLHVHRAPIKTTQPQPPRGLKLPTVASRTLRRLKNRQKVVSVDDVLSTKTFSWKTSPDDRDSGHDRSLPPRSGNHRCLPLLLFPAHGSPMGHVPGVAPRPRGWPICRRCAPP